MIAADQALAFGWQWVQAWNAHDLDAILRHYDNDVEFTSPYVVALGFDPSGTLHGIHTLRRYFAAALDRFPDLRYLFYFYTSVLELHARLPEGPRCHWACGNPGPSAMSLHQ